MTSISNRPFWLRFKLIIAPRLGYSADPLSPSPDCWLGGVLVLPASLDKLDVLSANRANEIFCADVVPIRFNDATTEGTLNRDDDKFLAALPFRLLLRPLLLLRFDFGDVGIRVHHDFF